MDEEEQYQEYNLDEETLSILFLFPTRNPSFSTPSLQQYERLVEGLSCGLCREVLFSPVMLRCSHRFCKDCLNRYLRAQRRVCPACRVTIPQLYTPKLDHATETLITAAFGDGRRLSKRLREVEQEGTALPPVATVVTPPPLVELRRAESQTDLRTRQKENAEDAVPIPVAIKRTKTADEDTRPKKKAPSEKKIKAAETERDNTFSRKSKLAAELRQIRKENAGPPPERKKRRSVMVIELDSSEPPEVQQVAKPEEPPPPPPLPPPQAEALLPSVPRLHPSISIIPQVSEMDSARKILSMRDLQQEEPLPVVVPMEVEHNKMEIQPEDEPSAQDALPQQEIVAEPLEEQPSLVSQEVMAARNALQHQFGTNFISKILELSQFPIFMRLLVSCHPLYPFTPSTSFSQMRLLARTAAHSVSCVLAEDLNVNRQAVRIFVCEEGTGSFLQVAASTKLQEINSRFWRSVGGFEIGEFGEYSEMLADEGERYANAWQNRVLYYCIDYSKIVH